MAERRRLRDLPPGSFADASGEGVGDLAGTHGDRDRATGPVLELRPNEGIVAELPDGA